MEPFHSAVWINGWERHRKGLRLGLEAAQLWLNDYGLVWFWHFEFPSLGEAPRAVLDQGKRVLASLAGPG